MIPIPALEGGGEHFCFFNQPVAAEANYQMFWASIRPLLEGNTEALARLDQIRDGFAEAMSQEMETMWASKLGLTSYDAELVNELLQLMVLSKADYTIFFRRLSQYPRAPLRLEGELLPAQLRAARCAVERWLQRWRERITAKRRHQRDIRSDEICQP